MEISNFRTVSFFGCGDLCFKSVETVKTLLNIYNLEILLITKQPKPHTSRTFICHFNLNSYMNFYSKFYTTTSTRNKQKKQFSEILTLKEDSLQSS